MTKITPKVSPKIDNIVPDQTGHEGEVLTSDGTSVSWQENRGSTLFINKIASEDISQFDPIYLTSSTHAGMCVANNNYTSARVVGIALTSVLLGEEFDILTFGENKDPSFNFALGSPLFVDVLGGLTITAPDTTGQFVSEVGYSMGTGAIYIYPLDPIELA